MKQPKMALSEKLYGLLQTIFPSQDDMNSYVHKYARPPLEQDIYESRKRGIDSPIQRDTD